MEDEREDGKKSITIPRQLFPVIGLNKQLGPSSIAPNLEHMVRHSLKRSRSNAVGDINQIQSSILHGKFSEHALFTTDFGEGQNSQNMTRTERQLDIPTVKLKRSSTKIAHPSMSQMPQYVNDKQLSISSPWNDEFKLAGPLAGHKVKMFRHKDLKQSQMHIHNMELAKSYSQSDLASYKYFGR